MVTTECEGGRIRRRIGERTHYHGTPPHFVAVSHRHGACDRSEAGARRMRQAQTDKRITSVTVTATGGIAVAIAARIQRVRARARSAGETDYDNLSPQKRPRTGASSTGCFARRPNRRCLHTEQFATLTLIWIYFSSLFIIIWKLLRHTSVNCLRQ